MDEKVQQVMYAYKFCTSYYGHPIVVIPHNEMERLCEYVAQLEAENADLRQELQAVLERV